MEHLGVDHEWLEAPKKAGVGQVIRERETDVGRLEREPSFMVGRRCKSHRLGGAGCMDGRGQGVVDDETAGEKPVTGTRI